MWYIARGWLARRPMLVPFRDAAAKLYEETRAADLLSDPGVAPCLATRLNYHARQLVQYAKHGKATIYGRPAASEDLVPLSEADLWAGHYDADMGAWVLERGIQYTELAVPRQDLARVIRMVKQSMRGHDALLAWCRHHAAGHAADHSSHAAAE